MHPTKKTSLVLSLFAAAMPLAALAVETGLEETGKAAGVKTTTSLAAIIGTVIKGALSLVGVVFLVLMVYGGYIWMIAKGDESKVDKAKNIISSSIIGAIIVAGAYAITNFIVSAFSK